MDVKEETAAFMFLKSVVAGDMQGAGKRREKGKGEGEWEWGGGDVAR